MNYYIEGCPIKFHDLLEIFEFLSNLSPNLLYQYDGLLVYNLTPVLWIHIFYKDNNYYITYLDYPK